MAGQTPEGARFAVALTLCHHRDTSGLLARSGPSGDELHGVRACLVAGAAARLVRVERADDDRLAGVGRRLAVDEPLGRRRRAAAPTAPIASTLAAAEISPTATVPGRASWPAESIIARVGPCGCRVGSAPP